MQTTIDALALARMSIDEACDMEQHFYTEGTGNYRYLPLYLAKKAGPFHVLFTDIKRVKDFWPVIDAMVEALEFYADNEAYERGTTTYEWDYGIEHEPTDPDVWLDHGEMARAVLARVKGTVSA